MQLDEAEIPLRRSGNVNGAALIEPTSMQDTWRRDILKGLCFAAVGIEPFFSWFLAKEGRKGLIQIIKLFITSTPAVGVLDAMETTAYIMAGFNLYCDYLSVSPARDADDLIEDLTSNESNKTKKESIQRLLTIGLMIASIIFNFPQGAAADNIPIAEKIFERFGETVTAYILNYSALVAIGLLGTIYYTMFCYDRAKNHVGKAIEIVLHPKDFAKEVFSKKFLAYTEVGMQAVSNTLYRAVNFGFLVIAEVQSILRANNQNGLVKAATWATMVETGILTLFTRTLSAHKHFLNPNFKYVEKEANELNGFRWATISDVVLSLCRGGGAGAFLYWMFSNYTLGVIIGYTTGALLTGLSFAERYNVAKYEKALDAIGETEVDRRKLADPTNKKEDKVISRYEAAKKTYDEIGKALHYPLKRNEIKSYISFAFVLFWLTIFANFVARLVRLISFFDFMVTLNETMKWKFTDKQNAAMTIFAGVEVTKNDFSNYREGNDNAIRDYRVSNYLQNQRDEENHNTGMMAKFTRVFRTVWNASPGSYSQAELDRALAKARRQDEESVPLLPRPATPSRGGLRDMGTL